VLAVNVAVLEAGRILLILREDFDVWCMPGGHVDPGEAVAAAAVREVWEETGTEVMLDRLVGAYSRPLWIGGGFHVLVFTATKVGGTLRGQPGEVTDARWFDVDDLPAPLFMGQRRRIDDAVAGRTGLARSSPVIFPFPSLAAALAERDASPLTRREFYVEHILEPNRIGAEADVAEAGDQR
jgi:8-oxo-dGTP pyrophosphatase MutT (NUDIX family)